MPKERLRPEISAAFGMAVNEENARGGVFIRSALACTRKRRSIRDCEALS
jgi:hypothetical protein